MSRGLLVAMEAVSKTAVFARAGSSPVPGAISSNSYSWPRTRFTRRENSGIELIHMIQRSIALPSILGKEKMVRRARFELANHY